MGPEGEIQPPHFVVRFRESVALRAVRQIMKLDSTQIGSTKTTGQGRAGRRIAGTTRRDIAHRATAKGDGTMQSQARSGRMEAVAPHPLAELLECPPATGGVLSGSTECIDVEAGDVVFQQFQPCHGLYVVISGRFLRKAERKETHLMLGPARAGDLVELAAVLGDGLHTYTLTAQTAGSVLLLPMEALSEAFQQYSPLRMHLLEELAREVCRAYNACCLTRITKARRRSSAAVNE